jgi:hypothetical protein
MTDHIKLDKTVAEAIGFGVNTGTTEGRDGQASGTWASLFVPVFVGYHHSG